LRVKEAVMVAEGRVLPESWLLMSNWRREVTLSPKNSTLSGSDAPKEKYP